MYTLHAGFAGSCPRRFVLGDISFARGSPSPFLPRVHVVAVGRALRTVLLCSPATTSSANRLITLLLAVPQGLIDLAFDPKFSDNGFFYVSHTVGVSSSFLIHHHRIYEEDDTKVIFGHTGTYLASI